MLIVALALLVGSCQALSKAYSVGPGQSLANISQVPWEALQAGDAVRIHWRLEPYREKWVISVSATREQPFRVSGVPGPEGQLPVILGDEATTRASLDFWNEDRGLIKIGGASHAPGIVPQHVILENLDLRSARPAYSYSGKRGRQSYRRDAAAVYIETGQNITIRNCQLSDCGNGFFANGRNVLVESCRIYGNGIAGSFTEHNAYCASDGIVFQFNYFGRLRKACAGNNLKDRSAGTVVRYNWFEGGSRQLDFVDAEDHEGRLVARPQYRETLVYGNVLVEGAGDYRSEVVHYGGDGVRRDWYRRGTLYFFHNTVVSTRPDITTLFRLSSDREVADVRNNVFYLANPLGRLALALEWGTFRLSGNWLSRGWVKSGRLLFLGNLAVEGGWTATDPGFVDPVVSNFRFRRANVGLLPATELAPAVRDRYPVDFEPVSPSSTQPVPRAKRLTIGAFE